MKFLDRILPVGPRSVLFGAHCFFIHPIFVWLAWWKLYGFPLDPRLYVAFFVHDIGYLTRWCRAMDDEEGERHVESGAAVMHWLFDHPRNIYFRGRLFGDMQTFHLTNTTWRDFSLYHSRFYAKKDGVRPSRLCAADKLATALEPWWLYLPRVWLSGEIHEYMAKAGGKCGSKYNGEPEVGKYVSMNLIDPSLSGYQAARHWHRRMADYLRKWAYEHKDGREDHWTPERKAA